MEMPAGPAYRWNSTVSWEKPETDHITERINLDSEALFIFRAVFFRRATLPSNMSHRPENARQNKAYFAKPWKVRIMPMAAEASPKYVNTTV